MMQLINCSKVWTPRACRQQQQSHQASDSPETQQQRKRCHPCNSRPLLPGECESLLSNDMGTQAGANASSSSGAVQMSLTLEDEEPPTILAGNAAKPKPRRQKRGYRIFYRPLLASANYYSVPFPAPESLKLECDGDSTLWEDLEVRVISHQGVVLWQDMQTRTEDILNDTGGAVNHRCKFGHKKVRTSTALLTIEAKIHHMRSPSAQVTESSPLNAAPPPPESGPAQCRHNGDRRPLKLVQQFKRMKQIQLRDLQLQPLQQLKQGQLPQQQQQQQQQHRPLPPPLPNSSIQQSLIPRLRSNWFIQHQRTQRLIGRQQTSREEEERLRRKLLINLHQMQRRSLVNKADLKHAAATERLIPRPSYMRPYSPVLHYPLPSKLPVATRGVKWLPVRRGSNTGCPEPLETWGIHP